MQVYKRVLKLARRTSSVAFTLITAMAIAQNPPADVCATIVREALQAANAACSGTSRNEVCYGNVFGQATAADGVADLRFEEVGDIAGLTQISGLTLSPLDEAANRWGVALMQLQANLPDTLPGQNVTFLMFGDVTIEENTGEQARIPATTRTASNLRLGPNVTGPVVGSVPAGVAVTASGKTVNQAGEAWVRVKYDEYRTSTGWVLAELVDVDLNVLPDVPSDSLTLNPMQAFYFRTGIGRTQCATAPIDGVVVQTPEGAGKVNFNVNGIDVALGSTAFLSMPAGETLTCISLLSGDADLQSANRGVDLNPGERSCAPIRDDGTSGPPGLPEPFDASEIASIAAVVESLPNEVVIPDPAPTRTPTALPTVAPTPTQVVVPTDVPHHPQQPTATPVARFVDVDRNRHGATVDFTANEGPDAAETHEWSMGEGWTSGKSVSFTFWPDADVTMLLRVCWSDGECIERDVNVRIPPCPIDLTQPTSISLSFDGTSEQYKIFRADEQCNYTEIADFGMGNPSFSTGAHVGEIYHVKDASDTSILVRAYQFYDTMPINDTIPGGSARQ
jgi:hypothetical protein